RVVGGGLRLVPGLAGADGGTVRAGPPAAARRAAGAGQLGKLVAGQRTGRPGRGGGAAAGPGRRARPAPGESPPGGAGRAPAGNGRPLLRRFLVRQLCAAEPPVRRVGAAPALRGVQPCRTGWPDCARMHGGGGVVLSDLADQRTAPPRGADTAGPGPAVRLRLGPRGVNHRGRPGQLASIGERSPANGLSLRIAHGYFGQSPLSQGWAGSFSSSTRRASAASSSLPSRV